MNAPDTVAEPNVTVGEPPKTVRLPTKVEAAAKFRAGPLVVRVAPAPKVTPLVAARVTPVVAPCTASVPEPAGSVRAARVTVTAAVIDRVAEPEAGAVRAAFRPPAVATETVVPLLRVTEPVAPPLTTAVDETVAPRASTLLVPSAMVPDSATA